MAKTTWGRKETIIWPQHRPIYTYGAIFVAVFLTAVFLYGRLRFIGTPLQRFYMPVYVRTSIFGSFSRTHRSQYRMLFLTGRGMKPSPAMNDDVVLGKNAGAGWQHHPSGAFSGCAPAWRRLALSRPGTELCGRPVVRLPQGRCL